MALGSGANTGIVAVEFQPAAMVGQQHRWEVHIATANIDIIDADIFASIISAIEQKPISLVAENKDFIVGVNTYLPSASYALNDRWVVTLVPSLNSFWVSESSDPVLQDILKNGVKESFYGYQFSESYLTTQSAAWLSVGLGIGYRILATDRHVLDVGIIPKMLSGQLNAHVNAEDMNLQLLDDQYVRLSGNIQVLFNEQLDRVISGEGTSFFSDPNFGFSAGAQYMWKQENLDGHRLKVGLAINEIGNLNFKPSKSSVVAIIPEQIIDTEPFRQAENLREFGQAVTTITHSIEVTDPEYAYQLPAKIFAEVDVQLIKNWYLTTVGNIGLTNNDRSVTNPKNVSTYMISGRYDRDEWSVALPIYYRPYGGWSSGICGRYRFVYGGVNNALSYVFTDNVETFSAFLGFRFGIGKR